MFFLFALVLSLYACETTHRISSFEPLEEKYARLLGVDKSKIINKKLYAFVDEWYGVKYQYAGSSKKGIDCSGLASLLEKNVYGKEISGPAYSIYNSCEKISKKKLSEGDLVFFIIGSKPGAVKGKISHMGVYLQNNKFVHASTKAGVIINDLDEEYYSNYFAGAGRIGAASGY